MKIRTFLVDAFTDEAFKGNTAGVCLLEETLEATILQKIAMEMNAAETAFITRKSENVFDIRYFSPLTEVPFCGHATLASSKVLMSIFDLTEVHLTTFFNLQLSAKAVSQGVEMDFPLYQTTPYSVTEEFLTIMGIPQAAEVRFCEPIQKILIEVASKDILHSLSPDFQGMLKAIPKMGSVVVTTASEDSDYDFYSRVFGPWVGINEDSVTGAAHTMLASYWSAKLGKTKMRAWQSSKRGGYMNLEIKEENKLKVTSNAVMVLEGWLTI